MLSMVVDDYIALSVEICGKGAMELVRQEDGGELGKIEVTLRALHVGICGVIVWLFHKETFAASSAKWIIEVVPAGLGDSFYAS